MAKHHPDLIICRRQPGVAIGTLCANCEGKCPICDSFVRPHTLAHICDQCNYGTLESTCIICSSKTNPSITSSSNNTDTNKDSANASSNNAMSENVTSVKSAQAYYCTQCVQLGKDRDGCPRVVNLGESKGDLFYERKKFGFKKR